MGDFLATTDFYSLALNNGSLLNDVIACLPIVVQHPDFVGFTVRAFCKYATMRKTCVINLRNLSSTELC
jgi:hypothetical protein